MSIFRRKNVLRDIKSKEDFLLKINKGVAINYVGITCDNDFELIKSLVLDYVSRDFERKMIILSGMMPMQVCFKLGTILKDYNHKVVTNDGFMTFQFENKPHRIHVQYYPTYGIDIHIFEHEFEVLLYLPDYTCLDNGLIKCIYNAPNQTNFTVLAPYPPNKDISMKTFFALRKYLTNMGFIDYDKELGSVCFVDILDKKCIFGVVKEKIQRLK